MSGTHVRTHSPQRTDSRPLAERKHSVSMRIAELRESLRQAEQAEAEISIAIEEDERARERARSARGETQGLGGAS